MTTPTPRTDAAFHQYNVDAEYDTFREKIRQLERELAHRDALIQRILDYPYLPQNLATIIRKELENV